MTATSTVDGAWYLKSLWAAVTSNLYAVPLFAVPVPILIWSFNKWMSYNQSNADRNTRIQDALDKTTYKEIIVPLHNALAANLAETVSGEMTEMPADVSVTEFLQQYEDRKAELLKQTDYTALEEVVKFQDAMELVIKEKRNKFVLKTCSRQNKRLMLAVALLALIQIGDSGVILVLQDSSYFSWSLYGWFFLLVAIIVLVGKYGLNENTIDNLEHV